MAQRPPGPPGDPGQYQAYGGMPPGMVPGQIAAPGNPQQQLRVSPGPPMTQQQLQIQQQQQQLLQQQRLLQQQQQAVAAAAAAAAAGRLPPTGMLPPGAVPLQALQRPGQPLQAGPALQAALRQPMGPPGGPSPGGGLGGAAAGGPGGSGPAGGPSMDGPSPGPASGLLNAEAYLSQSQSRYQPVQRRLMQGGGGSSAGADAQVLPPSQLDRLMRMQGLDQSFSLSPEVQTELVRIAEEFVADVVERGCQLAAVRKSGALRAADMAPYLERTHHIRIPGFGGELRPYRRPNASDLHRERTAAVRHSAAMGGGGGGGGGGPIRGRAVRGE